jgi:hypothetical protein
MTEKNVETIAHSASPMTPDAAASFAGAEQQPDGFVSIPVFDLPARVEVDAHDDVVPLVDAGDEIRDALRGGAMRIVVSAVIEGSRDLRGVWIARVEAEICPCGTCDLEEHLVLQERIA